MCFVECDAQLTLVHALIEPRAAEHEPAQPVYERALGRADELWPAVVDVLAERRGGVVDLAVDREVDEVFELILAQSPADEPESQRRLLAALGEVTSLKVKRSSPYSRTKSSPES